eukprot:1905725-Pleurochrysis_carterae.AAC.1
MKRPFPGPRQRWLRAGQVRPRLRPRRLALQRGTVRATATTHADCDCTVVVARIVADLEGVLSRVAHMEQVSGLPCANRCA